MAYGRLDAFLGSRNSWPEWLNNSIDHVASHPMGLLGTIAALRYRPRGPLPRVSEAKDNTVRLAIGPVNYSNQATLWATALSEYSSSISTSTFALEVPGGFDFPSDNIIPLDFYHKSRKWQLAQAEALTHFTHILVEAEEPLLGRLFGRSLVKEKEFFERAGVHLGYMAHGTDIRVPSVHAERTPWSPYRDSTLYLARLNELARANLDFLNTCAEPVFVSTPDLLLDLPQAHWVPVVIEPQVWNIPKDQISAKRPLKVVHVPSVQSLKGTQLIEPALHSLHDRGVIEYMPITGIPSQEMPGVIAQADIVLDQFRLGSYGVAACEAMAAGKAVIGHVLPEVRRIVQTQTGRHLPILEATPETLTEVLGDFAAHPDKLESLADEGKKFVNHVHSGHFSAARLVNNWIEQSSQYFSEMGRE